MNDSEYESSKNDRSVSYKDQLVYRITIQKTVDRCLFSMGTFQMARHVKALRTALFFQIPGLPFKDRIIEKEKQLDRQKINKTNELIKKLNYKVSSLDNCKVGDKAKIKMRIHEWYWMTKLEYLLDLLAEHDALLKPRDFVEMGELF